MAQTAPLMDSCEMPDATYQPQHSEWPHSSPMTFSAELAFQLNQEPNSDYSAQNLPAAGSVGSWAASLPSSGGLGGAIGDLSGYSGAIAEHAHPGGDGEVAMEVQSNECDAVSSPTRTKRRKRSKAWTKEETMVLLKCKEEWLKDVGGRYRKRKATNWNAIAEAVRDTCKESEKTGDQCRQRWDTLVKFHQRIKKRCHQLIEERGVVRGQEYVARVLAEDTWNSKLSPSSKRELYEGIDRIQSKNGGEGDGPVSAGMARAEAGLHALDLEGGPALGAGSIPAAAPGGPGMSKPKALQRFWSLVPRLRTTLLDQFLYQRLQFRVLDVDIGLRDSPSGTCEWLSAVQKRSRKDVDDDVRTLVQMRLLQVNIVEEEEEYGEEGVGAYVELEWSLFHELQKFVQKLMRKNPALDTHRCLGSLNLKELPSARKSLTPDGMRVLTLYECDVLESIDLTSLVKLRSLTVFGCPVLKKITGWEHVKELGWLEISFCKAYASYPDLQHFPSLRVCILTRWLSDTVDPVGHTFDISRCVQLRRLEIFQDKALKESGDLSSLKCLEELTFSACSALSTVDGLSELHSLTRLALRNCEALRSLPDIGDMKELVHIDISSTSVEEILGIEKLVSLKTLDCSFSKLKQLPDLHRLPELQKISLKKTPLTLQRGTCYFGKEEVVYNREERNEVNSDCSESSDAEDDYFELF